MKIVNEVLGTPERFEALLNLDIEGPVSMLHLLKFRELAPPLVAKGELLPAYGCGNGGAGSFCSSRSRH